MTAKQKAIKLFKKNQGLLRTAEAMRLGIHPRTLYQMRDEGLLEQLGKGVYRLIEVPDFSEPDLVLVSKKIPQGYHMFNLSFSLSRDHYPDPSFCLYRHSNKSKTIKIRLSSHSLLSLLRKGL